MENRTGVRDTASQPWKKEDKEVMKEVGGCAVIH
jgi:hypothetical protein